MRPVTVAEVRPLRQALLRPHQQVEELVYRGDGDPRSLHVGGFRNDHLVGIASIFPRPMPGNEGIDAWQVRGMAVEHGLRGYGLGGLLLERCVEHAAVHGARFVWCNAQSGSHGFFGRHGFRVDGDPLELPDIEPHHRMLIELTA